MPSIKKEGSIWTLRNTKGNELKVTEAGARIVSMRFRDKNFTNQFVLKESSVLVDGGAEFDKVTWRGEELIEGVKFSAEVGGKSASVIYSISNDNEISIIYEATGVEDISTEMNFALADVDFRACQKGAAWEKISAEIVSNAQDINAVNLNELGAGKAVKFKGTVNEFTSKAGGKRNTMTVTPEGYTGNMTFTVQLGSIYSGTAIRDVQTVKQFGDFTNQTEWSQYAKALNSQLDKEVVAPLAINESIQGKSINLTGAATASGNAVTITPVALTIE